MSVADWPWRAPCLRRERLRMRRGARKALLDSTPIVGRVRLGFFAELAARLHCCGTVAHPRLRSLRKYEICRVSPRRSLAVARDTPELRPRDPLFEFTARCARTSTRPTRAVARSLTSAATATSRAPPPSCVRSASTTKARLARAHDSARCSCRVLRMVAGRHTLAMASSSLLSCAGACRRRPSSASTIRRVKNVRA